MCARINDSNDGEGLGFAGYSSVEAGVQTSYTDVHEDITDTSGTSHAGGSSQSGSHASSKKGAAKKGAKNEVHPEKKDEPPMEVLYTAKDLRHVPVEHVFWDVNRGAPFTGGCLMIGLMMPNLEECGYMMPRERAANDEVRIVRSHLPYHKMRINPMAKYIYVTRNPKDCCVAMFHYIKHMNIYRFKEGQWDNFFEWFIRGRVCYNDYFDHIIHYWVHRKDCHVLFLTYENMTLDHKSHIFMLANFIGGVAGTMVKDRHMLKKLIHRSSYSYMSQFFKEESHLGNLTKGRIGEWKAVFSPAQAARLDRKFYERFGNSEIANLWRYIVRFDRPAT
ncbi:hypothetical protein HPB51_026118 [Rhipicephalus microplus]|uniref:Sulfotransferase domain-containing protein n=1 Tax=Rhipicephalus microplus TaxID=6941 RepID=A0A9J6FAH6_RHIMP|nr:hypothetical protein HPB51_026118 [Rhipicephalus microplus]